MTSAHKYARIETERRFLLRTLPEGLDTAQATLIRDTYWPGTRMRLRRMFNPAGEGSHSTESSSWLDGSVLATKLTQKYVAPGQPPEETTITNIYLNEAEYELFARLPGSLLVKRRTPYLYQGSGYSIDVFEGALAGLVLAELEAGQGSLPPGAVPAFAVAEVTAEPAFTGGELAHTSAESLAALLESWLGKK